MTDEQIDAQATWSDEDKLRAKAFERCNAGQGYCRYCGRMLACHCAPYERVYNDLRAAYEAALVRRCSTCRFLRPGRATPSEYWPTECRRHAPTVVVDGTHPKAVWPPVSGDDVCGDWEQVRR